MVAEIQKKIKEFIRLCGDFWQRTYRKGPGTLNGSNPNQLEDFEMFVVARRLSTRDYLCTDIKSAAERYLLLIVKRCLPLHWRCAIACEILIPTSIKSVTTLLAHRKISQSIAKLCVGGTFKIKLY